MWFPTFTGLIERRILANYRCDPEVVARRLPPPFRPWLQAGQAVAGVCLIRLAELRPEGWPRGVGLASENAAHRFAVEWEEGGETRRGVYVSRRDSNSRFNCWAGGRVFPGIHRHARFSSHESAEAVRVEMRSTDGGVRVIVAGRMTDDWPATSVFPSLAAASAFFSAGRIGYSPNRRRGGFDALELACATWEATPLQIEELTSSDFEDISRFPRGSVEFDCALLMRNVPHCWRKAPQPGPAGIAPSPAYSC